jgi:hypothetical protein
MAKIPYIRGAAKRIARAAGVMPPKNSMSSSKVIAHLPSGDGRSLGMSALGHPSMEDSFDQPSTSQGYEDALVPWELGEIAPYAEELPKVRQKDLKGVFYIPLRLERHAHREEYDYGGKKCVHIAHESNLEHSALQWNSWRVKAGKAPYWPIVKPHSMTETTWLRLKPLAELDPGKTKLYILLEKLKGNQCESDLVIGGYEAPVTGLGPFGRLAAGQRLWNAEAFAKHLRQAGLDQDYRFIRFYIPFSGCLANEWAEKFVRQFVKEMGKLGYHRLSVRGYRGEVSLEYKEFSNGGGFHRYARLLDWDRSDDPHVRPKAVCFEVNSWDVDCRSSTGKAYDFLKGSYKNVKRSYRKAKETVQQKAACQVMSYGYSHLKKKHLS